jgi:hypothetical protein
MSDRLARNLTLDTEVAIKPTIGARPEPPEAAAGGTRRSAAQHRRSCACRSDTMTHTVHRDGVLNELLSDLLSRKEVRDQAVTALAGDQRRRGPPRASHHD